MPDLRAADGRLALVARLRGLRRRAGPVVLRDEAVEGAARALAATGAGDALVVDVHGSSTSLARVTKSGELTAVHTRLGVGGGAAYVLIRKGKDVRLPAQTAFRVRLDTTVSFPQSLLNALPEGTSVGK